MAVFTTRLALVTRQLERAPYLAGDLFTAADISVGYALELARKNAGVVLGNTEQAYMARLRERGGYQRALEVCQATRTWWAS
jgi:glutathione S-transferase/3-isopropylmalate dehydratase